MESISEDNADDSYPTLCIDLSKGTDQSLRQQMIRAHERYLAVARLVRSLSPVRINGLELARLALRLRRLWLGALKRAMRFFR